MGHVGSSDWRQTYWPLLYQVATSESEDTAAPIFQTALDVIETEGRVCVSNVLVDGGRALESASKNLISRKAVHGTVAPTSHLTSAETKGAPLRRCFAHVIHMGNTRGGGKRGGKGCLPRYYLDQGVPAKVMLASMLSLFILFNCVPNAVIFQQAMTLLLFEYSEHINKHVHNKYLDPKDPRKLGRRAAGPQGMVGSTN